MQPLTVYFILFPKKRVITRKVFYIKRKLQADFFIPKTCFLNHMSIVGHHFKRRLSNIYFFLIILPQFKNFIHHPLGYGLKGVFFVVENGQYVYHFIYNRRKRNKPPFLYLFLLVFIFSIYQFFRCMMIFFYVVRRIVVWEFFYGIGALK